MTLQGLFEALISDLGGENFDPDGWQRDRIWEAIKAANELQENLEPAKKKRVSKTNSYELRGKNRSIL